jgi:hypothetical protein
LHILNFAVHPIAIRAIIDFQERVLLFEVQLDSPSIGVDSFEISSITIGRGRGFLYMTWDRIVWIGKD